MAIQYTKEQIQKMTLSDAEAALEQALYEASEILEQLEHAGKIRGNGHHQRQAISEAAKKALRKVWEQQEPFSSSGTIRISEFVNKDGEPVVKE